MGGLTALANIAPAATAFTTATPNAPALSIGSVTFADNEHPDSIPFVTTQRQAVHEMIGGFKQVQDMGTQSEPISWSGTFWESQATQRASLIKAMEIAAQPVVLSWNTDQYLVLIQQFKKKPLHLYRIPYEITVTVISDQSTASTASVAIDTQTQSLFTNALNAAQSLNDISANCPVVVPSALSVSLNSLGAQLNAAGPLAQASFASISAITSTCGSLQSTLTPYLASLVTAMTIANNGAINPAVMQSYMYASDLNASVTMINSNVQTGQAPQVVQVVGGTSLYHVAAMYCGDATRAQDIQAANGLASTSIPFGTVATIKIPPTTAAPLS